METTTTTIVTQTNQKLGLKGSSKVDENANHLSQLHDITKKKIDDCKGLNQFPDDEEPKILGHGPITQTDKINNKNLTQTDNNKIVSKTEKTGSKYKKLLSFEDAPKHLQFNPYIRTGYRTFLSTKHCLQSVFWWTNETINIWSHLFGYLLFLGLTITDINFLKIHAKLGDQVMVVSLLVCFQLCMLMSTIYHIFSCRSEKHYDMFLSVDFLGISLSLVAIYISGMYYAFWCRETLRNIYSTIAIGMFLLAMIMQVPKFNFSLNTKISVLLLWSVYGVIPLGHWAISMGGFENPLVKIMIPRVIIMYLLCGIAFFIYATRIPERWLNGWVDYCGHSHNWWHLFILAALYHWHNTGIAYAEYRMQHGCSVHEI